MAVENARATMAKYLHCKAKELVFTSGATESNNLAIKGIAYSRKEQGKHIITVATEHKAILDTCKQLEKKVLMSLSAHKFYDPMGIGCLFIRNRAKTHLQPLTHGGGQEYSLRPGTLATHQIAGMAKAFALANERLNEDAQHLAVLRHTFLDQLKNLDGITINGRSEASIPSIINISFEGVGADSLIIALRDKVAISSSSACNSGAIEASYVLRAMGIEGERLYSAVRFSFGRYTTEQEIKQAGKIICTEVNRLRELAM
ncbi:MAG: hypothetical protein methR_P3585 [Methyloprofundus sp.]|nr:MAG: hypothetical protein methR_P3585 [Methyloprofundus sp.]